MHARTHARITHIHTYIHTRVCVFVCVCARTQTHTHTSYTLCVCVCGPGTHTHKHIHTQTRCIGLSAHAHTMPIKNTHRLARAFARMLRRTSKRGSTLVFFILKIWVCSYSPVSRTGYSVLNFVYCCVNKSL